MAYIEKKSLDDFIELIKSKESIVITGHQETDADCLFSIMFMDKLIQSVNPDAAVYPITDVTEQMTWDTAELIKKYSIERNNPTKVKFKKKPDLMILVDNQIGTHYTIIPNGIPQTKEGDVEIDVSCWDHHAILDKTYHSDFRDDNINSTASIIINNLLAHGNEDYLKIIKDSPELCTVGYQALCIDTGLQEDFMVKADRVAHDFFQNNSADLIYLHTLNNRKINPSTAAILAKAYEPDSTRNIRDIATLCYIPRMTEGKGGELATVANELLRITTSLQNSIAAGIVDGEGDKENFLKLSIRANAPDRVINARKIAKRFNGGGEDLKAGARLNLGLLKYSCSTEEFKKLMSDEIEYRLVDSNLYEGEDKPEKPVFQKPTALDEILKDEEIEVDLAPHIANAAKNYSMRGNNNYLTLFANRDIDSEDETLKVLQEEDIPALIETGDFYLETLKKSKKYKSCNTSVVYGLITGGVEPYVVGIISSLKGKKKKNKDFDPENISSKVFGGLVSDKETVETEKLKREIIRVPLPAALKYTKEHQYIHKIIYNEIEERLGHSFGKKINNPAENPPR